MNDNYIQEDKTSLGDVKEIPTLGSWFTMSNLLSLKSDGRCFFYDLRHSQECSVFRVNLVDKTIFACDNISAQYVFDMDYVERDNVLGFYGMSYNTELLKDRKPLSIFSHGKEHDPKKEDTMCVLKHRMESVTLAEMSKVIQGKFESIDLVVAKEDFDFERAVDVIAFSFTSFVILGEVLPDRDAYREWFGQCIQSHLAKYLCFFTFGTAKRIAQKNLDIVRQTPTIQNIEKILPNLNDRDTVEGQALELMHNTYFNSSPVLSEYFISCIGRFHDSLTDDERQGITAEADTFLKQDPTTYETTFDELDLIDSFVLEVFRMNPIHVCGSHGRAKKDFVMESTTGKFQVRKGELITDFVFAMHRDPTVFDEPTKFKMTRDKQHVKEHLVPFGGPYLQKTTAINKKCPGQDMMVTALKLFVIHMTKCTMDVKSDVTYTGKVAFRGAGTDVPLAMNTFVYNKQTTTIENHD